jgi:hypothetical protein
MRSEAKIGKKSFSVEFQRAFPLLVLKIGFSPLMTAAVNTLSLNKLNIRKHALSSARLGSNVVGGDERMRVSLKRLHTAYHSCHTSDVQCSCHYIRQMHTHRSASFLYYLSTFYEVSVLTSSLGNGRANFILMLAVKWSIEEDNFRPKNSSEIVLRVVPEAARTQLITVWVLRQFYTCFL